MFLFLETRGKDLGIFMKIKLVSTYKFIKWLVEQINFV